MPLRQDQSHVPPTAVVTGPRRIAYLTAAGIFLLLGIAGAMLPVLPTTPFLLLTSYCLARCSPTLHTRLLNSRLFGPILRDWNEHRGVRAAVKMRAAALVVLILAASIYWGRLSFPWAVIVSGLGAIGLTVIAALPTLRRADNATPPAPHSPQSLAATPVTDPVD